MSWEEVAAAQDGLISRSQLLGTGLTVEAVRWLVTDGRLIRSCRGVYRVIGSPASPWTPLRAALLADRQEGESPLERTWLMRLRRAGVPRPVVGYQLVVGKRVLILDMAWPEQRIGIEIDGWSAHRTRGRFDADRERDLLATRVGWRLLHVTSRTPIREVTATLLPLLGQKVG